MSESNIASEQISECSWCPPGCHQCTEDRDCECYAHQDEPDRDLCLHDFLFRPESDTAQCLICGVETTYDEALLYAGKASHE